MEKLLKWSVENAQDSPATERKTELDHKALAELLGGPDEAQLMNQAMAVAVNPSNKQEDRVEALDNLEMLIESLDNANNMENMGLWPHLIKLFDDAEAEVRSMAAWVAGTAVQNNDKAQGHFAAKAGAVAKLLDLAVEDPAPAVAAKALFALSTALHHCLEAFNQFVAADGWTKLEVILDRRNWKLSQRVVSVVRSIALSEPHKAGLEALAKQPKIVGKIIAFSQNTEDVPDAVTAKDKSIGLLHSLLEKKFDFGADKALVKDIVKGHH